MGKGVLAAVVGLAIAFVIACGVAVAATVTHGFTGRQVSIVERVLPQPTVTVTTVHRVRVAPSAVAQSGQDPLDGPDSIGEPTPAPVPHVVGTRLNTAEATLLSAGYDVHVLNTGTIVNAHHWIVTRQEGDHAIEDQAAVTIFLTVHLVTGESP